MPGAVVYSVGSRTPRGGPPSPPLWGKIQVGGQPRAFPFIPTFPTRRKGIAPPLASIDALSRHRYPKGRGSGEGDIATYGHVFRVVRK